MPPKVKITRTDIINTAIDIIRQKGAENLNARSLANALNCSTQPIFSNFSSMDDLNKEIINLAYEQYLNFINIEVKSEKYPKYKAFGMAYIRFAKEEKELFKLLFMCDRQGKDIIPTVDFTASVELIKTANSVTTETAKQIHMEMWACAHGIATMLATSFCLLDWDYISNILTDVYQGIRHIHGGK
ncbi:MAG: TetR/AcrR family transcriptional regulator [Clostridia bacterium]|nr:TetR/AcrR family transcriptional regulator [Clostridia bacterium]